jgi:hypothetical protein
MRQGRAGEEHVREIHPREERGERASEEVRGDWAYINGPVNPGAEVSGVKKASRVYNGDDVKRQNDKNGMVKYDGKTEKI